jgi:hypothetical protein
MAPQEMQMDMHMLMGMYGLTGRLSIMLMTSYNNNAMEMKSYSAGHVHGGSNGEANVLHSHHTSGIGDSKVWALYKLLNNEGSSLVFSAGINFPTGNYKIAAGEHATYPGQRESYMMQLGSGSFDFLPGITYYKKKGKHIYSLQALAVIRPFANSLNYHLGNEITFNAWTAYQFNSSFSASLRLEGITGGEIYGNDPLIFSLTEPGADPENYGGIKSALHAGINYYINKSILRNSKIGAEFGIPIYQDLNGIQMNSKRYITAGITKSF